MDIEALDRRCKELQLSLPLHTTCDRALWYRTMNQANQNCRTYGHHLHTHICQKSSISQKIIWLWHTNNACKKRIHLIVEVELHPWRHHFREPVVGLMVVNFALIHRCNAGRWLLWHRKAGERLNHLRHQHKIKSEVTAYGADQRELSEDWPDWGGGEPVQAVATGEGLRAVVGEVVRPGGGRGRGLVGRQLGGRRRTRRLQRGRGRPGDGGDGGWLSERWHRGRASERRWGRSPDWATTGEGVWPGDVVVGGPLGSVWPSGGGEDCVVQSFAD
jgi:hypothetical protein